MEEETKNKFARYFWVLAVRWCSMTPKNLETLFRSGENSTFSSLSGPIMYIALVVHRRGV